MAQDVHDEAPADEYLPAAHDPVTDDRPAVAQYEPALQESQPLEPVEDSNLPDGQDEQLDAPADENLPTAHDPVTADRPAVAQYDPATHVLHPPEPVEGSYLPAGQDEHPLDPATEYSPAPHIPVHDDVVRPVEAPYRPAAQLVHDVAPVEER